MEGAVVVPMKLLKVVAGRKASTVVPINVARAKKATIFITEAVKWTL